MRRRQTPASVDAVDRLFALDKPDVARYDDRQRAIGRRIRVVDGQLAAVCLFGDSSGEQWLREWLTEARDVAGIGPLLLRPSRSPPGERPLRGRIVCNCFDVSEPEINQRLAARLESRGGTLDVLQADLKCGTNCGSCVAELKRLVAGKKVAA